MNVGKILFGKIMVVSSMNKLFPNSGPYGGDLGERRLTCS
jgi:hypothetical protein